MRKNTILKESSIRQYIGVILPHLEYIEQALEDKNIDMINQLIISEYRIKNSNSLKFAIIHYLRFRNKAKYIPLITKLKRKPKKKMFNWLSEDEIYKIIDHLDEPYKTIFKLQFETGARIREILRLRRDDIQERDGEYYIMIITKTNQNRYLKISPENYEMLQRFKEKVKRKFIFLRKDPTSYEELEKRIRSTYNKVARQFTATAKKVLNRKVGTHDIRRSIAEMIIKKDPTINGIRKAQQYLGHKDTRTTFIYFMDLGLLDQQ